MDPTKREVGHLLMALGASFEGNPRGINAGLLPSVRDLTAEQAVWRPGEGRHSIWQIVNHVAVWDEFSADVLAGKPPWPDRWWATGDWQPISDPSDKAWRGTLERLERAHAAVRTEVEKMSDDRLDIVVEQMGRVPLYGWMIGSALHKTYACGQIRYIRALQGVPTEPF